MNRVGKAIEELEKKINRYKAAKGSGAKYDLHSTQINLFDNCSEKDFSFARALHRLDPNVIYRQYPQKPMGFLNVMLDDPREIYGVESEPHVTILFGLVNEADYFNIRRDLAATNTFNITIGNVSSFRNEKMPYDVLMVDIESPELHQIHDSIKQKYENKESFPKYSPHLTISYIKKGTCKELEGSSDWTGSQYTISRAQFSHKEGYKLVLPIGGVK